MARVRRRQLAPSLAALDAQVNELFVAIDPTVCYCLLLSVAVWLQVNELFVAIDPTACYCLLLSVTVWLQVNELFVAIARKLPKNTPQPRAGGPGLVIQQNADAAAGKKGCC